MKAFLVSLFLFSFIQTPAFGQSFSRAMELYKGEQYKEAAELFLNSEDDRSQLFAGKSFLALTDYSQALQHLQIASQSNRENVREEALYSLAMTHFGLQNYDVSLAHLYDLANSDNQTGLRADAQRFYNQILNYLSINDRYETLYRLTLPAIQYDLVNSSKPFLQADTYKILVDELLRLTGDTFSRQQAERQLLSNLSSQTGLDQYPSPPEGIVYNIGVILPTYDENDPDFTIPRNLYFGMVLAADNFNGQYSNKKINLIFRNSDENIDTTATAFSDLAWTKKADAVIGPLFSEPAARMAQLAEEFRIPMVAPLANSDSLNRDYNYMFQMNPTFEVRGKKMAQYAVQELNLNSFTIIAEKGSLGRGSALAFRHEAERLGATITYYIEEDFAATGYDFSQVAEVFTSDAALRDSLNIQPSQAVYAPFTGEGYNTMINLLMNNLEAMNRNMVILGSEQWEGVRLTSYQEQYFDIYYTKAFTETPNTSALNEFNDDYETRFGTEPDRFSRIGYDTANFLFQSLETAGNPDYLSHALRTRSLHQGLAFHVNFDGKRINQHVFIRSLTEDLRQ